MIPAQLYPKICYILCLLKFKHTCKVYVCIYILYKIIYPFKIKGKNEKNRTGKENEPEWGLIHQNQNRSKYIQKLYLSCDNKNPTGEE